MGHDSLTRLSKRDNSCHWRHHELDIISIDEPTKISWLDEQNKGKKMGW